MTTLISIIIPCFNHGEFLEEALRSIEEKINGTSFEVIITDDGSTQMETIRSIESIEQRYPYIIIRQQNQGLAAARNNAIKASKGKYILPLDADNKLNMAVIKKCVDLLEEKAEIDIVYTDCIYFGERKGYCKVGEFNLINLVGRNYIDACAVYRKEAWQRCGGYDPNMPVMGHEDWELWLHMSFTGSKFYYLAEPGFYYRVSNTSMLRTITAINEDKSIEYIIRKHSQHIAGLYHLLFKRYLDYQWTFNSYMKENKVKSILKTLLERWDIKSNIGN